MKKNQRNSLIITILLIVSIIAGNTLMNFQSYFKRDIANAAIFSGTERTANQTATGVQQLADVAADAAGNFVAVWEGNQRGYYDIYFQRYDSEGSPRFDSDRAVNAEESYDHQAAAVATDKNGNFIVTWQQKSGPGNTYIIYVQAYKASGITIGDPVRVNTTATTTIPLPDIAMGFDNDPGSGSFVVVWKTSATGADVMKKQFTVDFSQAGPAYTPPAAVDGSETIVNDYTTGNQKKATVAMNTYGEFIITWFGDGPSLSGDHVWYRAYDNIGQPLNTDTRIDSSLITSASMPAVASDKKTRTAIGGNFIITYQGVSTDTPNGGIYARQILCEALSCNINPVEINAGGSHTAIDSSPRIDMDAWGNSTITWEENTGDPNISNIYGQSFTYNDGKPFGQIARKGARFKINTVTTDKQIRSAIAMTPDGQYVSVYETISGTESDIKYQQFVSNLFKVQNETLLHEANSAVSQHDVDVAVGPNGKYAAVYVDQSDPPKIMVALFEKQSGLPVLTQQIQVSSSDGTSNANPSISYFQDTSGDGYGRFIVAWEGVTPACAGDPDGLDIFYREIDSTGTVQGSCETRVNNETTGDQKSPDVGAGIYQPNGQPVSDNFAIVYKTGETNVESAYHDTDTFYYNIIAGSCTSLTCLKPKVAMSSNGNQAYVWENDDGDGSGVFIYKASGSEFLDIRMANDSTAGNQSSPDVAYLTDINNIIVSYTNSLDGVTSIIWKRINFPDLGDIDFGTAASGPSIGTTADFSKIFSSPSAIFVVWTDLPNDLEENQIYGRYFEYSSGGGTFGSYTPFGPAFRVNSTQAGSQSLPAVGMNTKGDVAVAWEGNFVGASSDSNGAVLQGLINPLYAPAYPQLQPEAEQQIIGGGKTLTVPSSITYPAGQVNTANVTTKQMSIRDPVNGGADNKFIEIQDLDGAGFTLSVMLNSDFMLGAVPYILRSDAFIRSWDRSDTETDSGCSVTAVSTCFLTENDSADPGTFSLNSETEDFASLETQRILATKTSDHEIGKWKLYPEFKLNIPARTPPGNHTTTITFSLI